jgi:hypothetical protein
MPWSHRPSWGPHFGTLVYRRALLDTPGVGFSDTSEAEDYGFAQSAVQKAGAKLTVLPATVDVTGGALFACVRHGSNTWEWDEAQTREKLLRHGTEVDAAARLPAAERAFGRRMASEGVLSALPARRAVSPAPRRFVDASVDRAFFADLFYPPEARAALAAARGAAEQPVGDMPTAMGDLLGLQHLYLQQHAAPIPWTKAPPTFSYFAFDWATLKQLWGSDFGDGGGARHPDCTWNYCASSTDRTRDHRAPAPSMHLT